MIWKERNNLVFNLQRQPWAEIARAMAAEAELWCLAKAAILALVLQQTLPLLRLRQCQCKANEVEKEPQYKDGQYSRVSSSISRSVTRNEKGEKSKKQWRKLAKKWREGWIHRLFCRPATALPLRE
uniref:Uncharacterized protein n=1 Tax=Oryza rufipogon TaxID=4529 RepID=A0A0E0NR47_ORYRU